MGGAGISKKPTVAVANCESCEMYHALMQTTQEEEEACPASGLCDCCSPDQHQDAMMCSSAILSVSAIQTSRAWTQQVL